MAVDDRPEGEPVRDDVWPIVHAERAALIRDLECLDASRWQQPSLCEDWTVHDVVAHLVDNARTTRLGFVVRLAGARFDFDRQNARGVERERCASSQQTLERFRQVASRKSSPPAPRDSRIVEEVVHGEDIRRPLGLTRNYPREAVLRALRLQVRTPASFGGVKELVTAVQLRATDADVTLGEGPGVNGPVLALLLAVSRRMTALDDLEGPGTDRLAKAIHEDRAG